MVATDVLGRVAGKTVFVTGGAHGMGLSATRLFLAEGASVFILDIDTESLNAVLDELGHRARGFVGDVRSRADVEAAVAQCERELGPVDILLNHTGIGVSTHTLRIDEAEWDEVLGINLTGVFHIGQIVARRMTERQSGVILNMASSGGIAAEPGHAHYAASKAAILALTRAMAHDLGRFGIRVCALCPGDIATYEWGNVEQQRLYQARIAAGRAGMPEEVAAVYLYLASDDAAQVTGSAFIVDGGMLAWE